MTISKLLSILVLVFLTKSDGAKILAVSSIPCSRHQQLFNQVWRELSLRGHQVTSLATDPLNDPKLTNLTEIDLGFSYPLWNAAVRRMTRMNFFQFAYEMAITFDELADLHLSNPKVQNLIKNTSEHFDLVLVEFGPFPMFAFSKRFNAPLIGVSGLSANVEILRYFGNPDYPTINPHHPLGVDQSSVLDRVYIIMTSVYLYLMRIYYGKNPISKKHFGFDYSETELINSLSLAFVNSNPVLNKVMPLVPSIIEIGGGGHRTEPKELPKEFKTVLEGAKNGCIYFSLGSNIKNTDLPVSTRNIILETFTELPYQVLWKFEGDLGNKPKNVLASKWFPQQDILRHPNVKLFITHGGLQSLDEAIYAHVPIVGLPFYRDQHSEIKRLVSKGVGLAVDYNTMTKETLKRAILEVINNNKYRKRVEELAELADDRIMTGLEKAIWWTEYVLRHKGIKHLRSPVLDIPWYQYYCLDVIASFMAVIIATIFIIVFITKTIVRLIRFVFRKKVKTN